MPNLLVLAPCDNVLISRQGESASLIVILSEVHYVKPAVEVPVGAIMPMRWFIFCQWELLPEEAGQIFEQKIDMLDGRGQPLISAEQILTTPDRGAAGITKLHHRVIAGLPGFPMVDPGIYRIAVSLRKKGDNDPSWRLINSYPLLVGHATQSMVEAPAI